MKRFPILTLALAVTVILSACGASDAGSTPTVSPVDLQLTVVAAAYNSIAETQAALPTATIPPTSTITNTPLPTATFMPTPTPAPPTANVPGAGDPCLTTVLPASLTGNKIKIRIDNPTKSTLMVSVNLHQAAPQGQCGYRGYSLDPQGSLVITDLVEGCYSIWAWNPEPKDYFMVTNGTDCLNSSGNWAFDISKVRITLKQ
jgi:hypothetical protein